MASSSTDTLAAANNLLKEFLSKRGLHVLADEHKGRCLIASRDFHPGEVVLEQDAYESVVLEEAEAECCDSCFSTSGVKHCTGCKLVRYCCRDCQVKQWKVHAVECRAIASVMRTRQRPPSPTLRLCLRILIKSSLQLSSGLAEKGVDRFDLVRELPSHLQRFPEEKLLLFAQMATLVKTMEPPGDPDTRFITEILCMLACNAHTITDDELRVKGTGLFPVISIGNHSCEPNTGLVFTGRSAQLRAYGLIRKGTEFHGAVGR
eukprot:TRINITY_DN918_c0_g1_i4.p1 TRINITY_DN918_c0_g1~~TRINITY_DN918_c0_g1_i4.p1  ORF type:complete len:262 (-),score=17.57 TRINITY_DN918_c0_g1_i4:626-1411(-)